MEHKRSGMPLKMLVIINVCVKEIFINMECNRSGLSFRNEHPLKSDQRFHRTAFVSSVGQI